MRPSLNLNFKITLLTVIVLPVLLVLGQWQLQRAEEKRHIADQLAARAVQDPVAIDTLASGDGLAFRRVELRGEFDNAHPVLLDNRMQAGRVGYDVLTPFQDRGGRWVLLNRGWLAAGASRAHLPAIPPAPAGTVTVTGQIYVPPGDPLLLMEQNLADPDWPLVIQAVEMDKLAAALGRDLFPRQVRIEPGEPGALVAQWQAINMRPEQHIAYAVQWFALAAALVVWFIFANTNLWQLLTRRLNRSS